MQVVCNAAVVPEKAYQCKGGQGAKHSYCACNTSMIHQKAKHSYMNIASHSFQEHQVIRTTIGCCSASLDHASTCEGQRGKPLHNLSPLSRRRVGQHTSGLRDTSLPRACKSQELVHGVHALAQLVAFTRDRRMPYACLWCLQMVKVFFFVPLIVRALWHGGI